MSQFRVFISYSSHDDNQYEIYKNICDKYENHENIEIIDVSINENKNLLTNVFNEIDNCNSFICLLTPNFPNGGKPYINNNVLLELGHAIGNIPKNKIHIFVEQDENKKRIYEDIRPSMLAGLKYENYYINDTENEEITSIIDKQNKLHISYNYGYNLLENKMVNDKYVFGNIKKDFCNLLQSKDINNYEHIEKIQFCINDYLHYDIIEYLFLCIKQNVSTKNFFESDNFIFINFFLNILSDTILDYDEIWFNKKNNHNRIFELLDNINYLFFHKCKQTINNDNINIVRMNFALSIFRLSKNKNNLSRDKFINLLNRSKTQIKDRKYNDYINKLEIMEIYNQISKNMSDKIADSITFSNTIYNKTFIIY